MFSVNEKDIYNWPGWELTLNEHGNEFDSSARERMVSGGLELTKYIYKHLLYIGTSILEVGPFFNPITKDVESSINSKFVTYWENDPYAIQWLHNQEFSFDFEVKKCDLNNLRINCDDRTLFRKFDTVIVSQVFNYIDYFCFLKVIAEKVCQHGLIFVNNVVDYGLSRFFSEERPKSIEETVSLIEISGFEIVEYEVIFTKNLEFQKHDRLLLVGRRR